LSLLVTLFRLFSIDPVAKFDIITHYLDDLEALSHFKAENPQAAVKFIYTAMHGVGHPFAKEAFKRFHLPPFHSVERQQEPDPDFSTVKFPNPEEGKDSLDLSIQYGGMWFCLFFFFFFFFLPSTLLHLPFADFIDQIGASIILANDPDADRFSATEKQPNGQWRIFTGNEIGVLLAVHVIEQHRAKHPSAGGQEKLAMLRSAVSSCMIDSVCHQEQIKIEETLTGFKWLGNRAIQLEGEGYKILLAYEEAIGFMLSEHVKDKDGVTTLAVFGEMASALYKSGLTLATRMDQIFAKYGYFVSNNSYFISHSNEAKQAVFEDIRHHDGATELNYPKKIGAFEITGIRDLQVGYDSTTPDHKPLLPSSKSNMMVTVKFAIGAVATIRTSGTEPKVKFYIEHHGAFAEKDKVAKELQEVSEAIIEHLIKPKKHGLLDRPTGK